MESPPANTGGSDRHPGRAETRENTASTLATLSEAAVSFLVGFAHGATVL